jgi:cysteine peptidase B
MKVVFVLLVCLGVALGLSIPHATIQSFIEFQHTYGRFYSSPEEYQYRLAVFNSNLIRAAHLQQNAGNATKFGITKYMDMTPEEFRNTILMSKMPPRDDPKNGPYVKQNFTAKAPAAFDWRSRPGVVTPVYNQGQCGSCWAFSATENIESQWALSGHPLASLSQQQIVSCDPYDYGCNGGWPYNAYKYVIGAGGQEYYQYYPYTAQNTPCEFNAAYIDAKITGWAYVTQNQNEGEMVNYLVAHGPLSICVDAEPWQFYSGGILMASQCSTSIDHCVEAIGYNMNSNPPYWIVRNSWGTDWGIQGYIYLQYGQNTCAMAEVVTNSQAA